MDYESWILRFIYNGSLVELPLHADLNKFRGNDYVTIPPRTELVQAINFDVPEDSVVRGRRLKRGVFLLHSVVPAKGPKHVKIVNTSDSEVVLRNFKVTHEPLKNFYVIKNATPYSVEERKKLIRENFTEKLRDQPSPDKDEIIDLCVEYHDIFHLPNDTLTANNFYEQDIQLTDPTPIYRRNYRTPHSDSLRVRREVEKLIESDIVEPSVSAYNSPIFLVPKAGKAGSFRLVVDFRGLNEKLSPTNSPYLI